MSARSAGLGLAGFLALVLLSRLALLLALGAFTGGEEPADDVFLHVQFIRQPLALLAAARPEVAQYPPLLPLAEAALARPLLAALPDFYAVRLSFLAWEVALAALLWRLLGRLVASERARLRACLAFLCLPAGWMSSTVMAEEEAIPAVVLAAALWLAATGRNRAALLVCGLGVAAAKVYLLVPLAALVLLLPSPSLPRRALWALALPLAVYAVAWAPYLLSSSRLPLVAFTPDPAVNVNLWAAHQALGLSAADAKRLSTPLTAAALIAVLGLAWRRFVPEPAGPRQLAALVAGLLAWAFLLAYHVNPEYYLLALVPALVATAADARGLALVALAFSAPWAVNVAFGLDVYATYGGAPGKHGFLELYRRLVPLEPATLHALALTLSCLATAALALWLTRAALGPEAAEGSR